MENINNICVICGKKIDLNGSCYYSSVTPDRLVCSDKCFKKELWDYIKVNKKEYIIINHKSYHLGDENSKSSFRGHGGSKFVIRMKDTGKLITTTNLWSQGIIPEEYYKDIEDNAEFVL
jgi:predicted nucleic acid-binding Zn ribbon protein